MRPRYRFPLAALLLSLLVFPALAPAAEPTPAQLDFFEKKIRPVLVEHCYRCHSQQSEKIKGGLTLDTRVGLLQGGNSGPAVVPGNPEASLLIRAVRYTDKGLQMPPRGKKLAAGQITDLEAWIRMGAPDPRRAGAAPHDADGYWARARRHWAFRPVQCPPLPPVQHPQWLQSPVDAFVLAAMEKHGLAPSPPADRRALLRRASYDLIGLPPTPEAVAAFERDPAPDAFARAVDRLLASPHYGERWGRHWLDVARYSDSKGYVSNEADNRYFYAYTYRDYVIRAFNEDLSYDRFLIEQMAADQLPAGADNHALAALGFLTVGKRHLNVQNDILDDRIDVVTRGTMGLTVACARCHDHKYDPIPTRDYYSLYGVFASCTEPEPPLLNPMPLPAEYPAFVKELAAREAALKSYRKDREDEVLAQLRRQAGLYLRTVHETQRLPNKFDQDQIALERKLDLGVVQRWRDGLRTWAAKHDQVFAPWTELADLPQGVFLARATELGMRRSARRDPARPVNPLVVKAVFGQPLTSFDQVVERYARLLAEVDRPTPWPDPDTEAVRQVLYGPNTPANLPRDQLDRFYDKPVKHHLIQLQIDVNDVLANHPGSPPRALVLQDLPKPQNAHIFLQGNPGKPGAEAPRQFLELLSGGHRQPFPANASGRLQLAQAIASRDNPLTARVLVNRVWLHHFGTGLVRTPSDFGVRAEPPTHPELLDYLAWRFMEDGWSIKKLHRLILLSSTYQQTCADNPQGNAVDPGNRWLWRMNRRRLDFEALRDSLLAVSGRLDLTPCGRPADLTAEPFPTRRAVYGEVDRLNFPDLLRTFDFPNPDKTIAKRLSTTIPQQALFFMNNPLVIDQARTLAARAEAQARGDAERVRLLYQWLYQRDPRPQEVELARVFVRDRADTPPAPPEPPDAADWEYGTGVYDPAGKWVQDFRGLTHFADNAWQEGPGGSVRLTAEGGTAGLRRAAVRRWVAPRDGIVRVTGTLGPASGGGMRGRLVAGRMGELASWSARQGPVETRVEPIEVRRGDTLDFVAEAEGHAAAFRWAPHVRIIDVPPGEAAGLRNDWQAVRDFRGPPRPLGPWEQYVHVLLMANEFAHDN
jgi:hypothetical protein